MVKKFLSIILTTICLLSLLVGCNKNEVEDAKTTNTSDEIIKIMENVYVDYINDIYLDREKYLGKIIEIEGMFTAEPDDEDNNHMYVYRIVEVVEDEHDHNHDDSSEDSHNHEETEVVEEKSGLEFSYDKDLPKENDWIKITGKLVEKDGSLIIEAKSVEILKDRGLEKVTSFY